MENFARAVLSSVGLTKLKSLLLGLKVSAYSFYILYFDTEILQVRRPFISLFFSNLAWLVNTTGWWSVFSVEWTQ